MKTYGIGARVMDTSNGETGRIVYGPQVDSNEETVAWGVIFDDNDAMRETRRYVSWVDILDLKLI